MDKDQNRLWELLAAKQYGELSEEELNELLRILSDCPDDLAIAERIKIGLNTLPDFERPDHAKSWKYIQNKIRSRQVYRLVIGSIKYAAIIVLSIVLGYFIQNSANKKTGPQFAEIEVQYGQTGHLFLFDGTEVWLNSGSKLKYPSQFNVQNRDVFLEGEAYFQVKHNEKLPFKVKTKRIEVEVLGTSFNVSAYSEDADVAVVLEKGKVKINQSNGKALADLVPGEIAELNIKSNKLVIHRVETKYYTDWKDGNLEFSGEPLGDIAQKLERWYNVEINIQDTDLVNYQITGTVLRNKPVQQIIQAFEFLAPVHTQYISKPNQKDIINIYKK